MNKYSNRDLIASRVWLQGSEIWKKWTHSLERTAIEITQFPLFFFLTSLKIQFSGRMWLVQLGSWIISWQAGAGHLNWWYHQNVWNGGKFLKGKSRHCYQKEEEEEEGRDDAWSQTTCHVVVTVVTAVPQRERLLWEGSGENQGSGRKWVSG